MAAIIGNVSGTATGEEFVRATTKQGHVAVRSGPGAAFFTTSLLPANTDVEVFRRKGDWLGIRPPEDSFSWVATDAIRIRPDGLGEIVIEGVLARVGSPWTDKKNYVQVELQPGELVEVLARGKRGKARWTKIAPPSGEFRWIARADVEFSSESGSSRQDREDAVRWIDIEEENSSSLASHHVTPPSRAEWKTSERNPVSRGPTPRLGGGRQLMDSSDLAKIELELATITAEDASKWRFDQVRNRCYALAHSADQSTRHGIAEILSRIARLESIRDRRMALQLSARSTGPVSENSISPELATRFDGVGRLKPVVAKHSDAPEYALVNEDGQVTTFVTPPPGESLQAYLGKRVGVVGTRGFIPSLKAAHVTAARISPLNVSGGTQLR